MGEIKTHLTKLNERKGNENCNRKNGTQWGIIEVKDFVCLKCYKNSIISIHYQEKQSFIIIWFWIIRIWKLKWRF